MNRDYRITVPHSKDDYHEWVCIPGWGGLPEAVMRDSIGRKRRGAQHRWIVLICNNPGCPAQAIAADHLLTDGLNLADPAVKP